MKLKVTLDKEEAEALNINIQDGEYDNRQIKHALKEILAEAGAVAGFEIGSDKVLVQLYPTPDGCELFVTRLASLGAKEKRMIDKASNLTTYSRVENVFCFKSLNLLTRGCRAVRDKTVDSDVYISDTGEYYLVARETVVSGIGECEVLCEFGERLSSLPEAVRGERGKLLMNNEGIEVFSQL